MTNWVNPASFMAKQNRSAGALTSPQHAFNSCTGWSFGMLRASASSSTGHAYTGLFSSDPCPCRKAPLTSSLKADHRRTAACVSRSCRVSLAIVGLDLVKCSRSGSWQPRTTIRPFGRPVSLYVRTHLIFVTLPLGIWPVAALHAWSLIQLCTSTVFASLNFPTSSLDRSSIRTSHPCLILFTAHWAGSFCIFHISFSDSR